MDILFDGKTVVITGGAGGIGSVCAKTLLESGAKVAIMDVAEDSIQRVVEELSSYGNIKGYSLDITDVNAIRSAICRVREDMGEIEVLVQTAGLL